MSVQGYCNLVVLSVVYAEVMSHWSVWFIWQHD